MATPRTTRTKKETELIVDDETSARVVETQDRTGTKKIITYDAKVKEKQSDDFTEDDTQSEDENLFQDNNFQSQNDYQTIPKDKLDIMFDDIENEAENPNDIFYAKLTRLPDAMQDTFYAPCNNEMPLGVFQFSLIDRFSFISAIQKKNNDSGGRFNVAVYDANQKQFEKFIRYSYDTRRGQYAITAPVGCVNLLIPNPRKQEQTEQQQNGQFNLMEMFVKLDERNAERQRQSEERTEKILLAMREKSPMQERMEMAMFEKFINPPPPESYNPAKTMDSIMQSVTMTQALSQALAQSLTPPQPHEPSTMETIKEFASTPLVTSIFERIGDIAETVTVAKMQAQMNANAMQNPNQLQGDIKPEIMTQQTETETQDEQQHLINDIIDELESETPLTVDNAFLSDLRRDFPKESNELISLCKALDFESVFKVLLMKAENINPFPFIPFLDVEETQKANAFVWNERGEKLKARLQEFYEVVKTV